jgi:hypothetical protein
VVIEKQIPFEYYLFMENKKQEISINCENIESFVRDEKSGKITLIYTITKTDWLGRQTEEMIRKIDTLECAEGEDLLRVWKGIRTKLADCANDKFVRKDVRA